MAPTPIKAGDTVYSTDGGMALYVAHALGGGHIVQPLIEDGDGITEPESHYADGVEIWPTCHREPPQLKLDAEIRAQTEKLAALRREVAEVERTKRETEREGAALRERLGMHAALASLDDLLSGRVTHYVIDNSENSNKRWELVTAEKFYELRRHYTTASLTLVSTFNMRGASVQWKFSHNASSNEAGRDAFAFTSEAEARAKVVELVTHEVTETAKHASSAYWLSQRIAWCRKQGVEPPADSVQKLADMERSEAESAAKKARDELARAQAKLDALSAA